MLAGGAVHASMGCAVEPAFVALGRGLLIKACPLLAEHAWLGAGKGMLCNLHACHCRQAHALLVS